MIPGTHRDGVGVRQSPWRSVAALFGLIAATAATTARAEAADDGRALCRLRPEPMARMAPEHDWLITLAMGPGTYGRDCDAILLAFARRVVALTPDELHVLELDGDGDLDSPTRFQYESMARGWLVHDALRRQALGDAAFQRELDAAVASIRLQTRADGHYADLLLLGRWRPLQVGQSFRDIDRDSPVTLWSRKELEDEWRNRFERTRD